MSQAFHKPSPSAISVSLPITHNTESQAFLAAAILSLLHPEKAFGMDDHDKLVVRFL